MERKAKRVVMTASVAGLLAAAATGLATHASAQYDEMGGGEGKTACYGINACKGNGDCGGPGHSCRGKNECRGHGYLDLEKETCLRIQGGRLTPEA